MPDITQATNGRICRCIPNIAAAMRDGVNHDPNVTHPVTACDCTRCALAVMTQDAQDMGGYDA